MDTIKAPAANPSADLPRPRSLECSCCGATTRGRQWWNRDTGYGLCVACIDYCAARTGGEPMERLYGTRGVHYDVAEA